MSESSIIRNPKSISGSLSGSMLKTVSASQNLSNPINLNEGCKMSNRIIRVLVRGAYDIQKLRIQMGNRIVGNYKARLGIPPGTKEKDQFEADKILKEIKSLFKKITDGVVTLDNKIDLGGNVLIADYTELCLVKEYLVFEAQEEMHFKRIQEELENFPIWTEYLKNIRGVGPAMAGIIISEFDIEKAKHISAFWKYAGLDVAEDGKGRSRREEHLVPKEYVDKKGELKTRMSITFNPLVKTKLTGVLAGVLIRLGNEKYVKIYKDYKFRLENHAVYKDTTKLHRHRMATRYMMKIFLSDLWLAWRALEGLPITEPYAVAKLGMQPHGVEVNKN